MSPLPDMPDPLAGRRGGVRFKPFVALCGACGVALSAALGHDEQPHTHIETFVESPALYVDLVSVASSGVALQAGSYWAGRHWAAKYWARGYWRTRN